MTKRTLSRLRGAMDSEEWQWLQDERPMIADSLSQEVADGASPEEIEQFIKAEYGTNRDGLARRMRSAARHLHSVNAQSRA